MYRHHHNLILFCFILAASLGMQNLSSHTRDPICAPCSGGVVLTTGLPGKCHHNLILEHFHPLPRRNLAPVSSLPHFLLGSVMTSTMIACSGYFIYVKLYNMCSFASGFVHLVWYFPGPMYRTPSLLFHCSTTSLCMDALQFVYPSIS